MEFQPLAFVSLGDYLKGKTSKTPAALLKTTDLETIWAYKIAATLKLGKSPERYQLSVPNEAERLLLDFLVSFGNCEDVDMRTEIEDAAANMIAQLVELNNWRTTEEEDKPKKKRATTPKVKLALSVVFDYFIQIADNHAAQKARAQEPHSPEFC